MAESPTDEGAGIPPSVPNSLVPLWLGRRDPPPLRIHHIMVATAVVAVLLSISYSLRHSNSLGLSTFAGSGQGIVMAISSGLAATGCTFGFIWRGRGYSFLDQPGHWLLVAQSLMVGLFVFAALINSAMSSVTIGIFFFLLNIAAMGVNLWAAAKIADSIPWTLIFLIDGLLVLFIIGGTWLGVPRIFFAVIWGAPIATLILLLLAAWGDRRDYVRRDWPHWFGVWLRFGSTLLYMGRLIWNWIAILVTA